MPIVNPADQAREIAKTFANMSRSVDRYIEDHLAELTSEELDFLEGVVRQLDDTHDWFVSTAIQETLDALKEALSEIAAITQRAERALQHLDTVAKVTKVVALLAELGADITSGDYGAIPSALTNLAEALPDKA